MTCWYVAEYIYFFNLDKINDNFILLQSILRAIHQKVNFPQTALKSYTVKRETVRLGLKLGYCLAI